MDKTPKHSKKVNEIYVTSDYSIFKRSGDNRNIRANWVNQLAKSMKMNGFYPDSPIEVNEKMTILDGHHRFEAAQLAGVPVYYFIDKTPGSDFEKMMRKNEMVHVWQKGDSLPGLAARKYKSYVVLNRFVARFPDFRLTEQIMFLNNAANDANKLKFTRGQWEHNNEATANEWAKNVMELKPYFKQGYNKSIFVRAMIDIFAKHPEFKFNEFLHRVKMRPDMIHMCGTKDHYKEMIENIYNYRRNAKAKVNLRF